MYRPNIMLRTDGYKIDHRRQYPYNTQGILLNFTPRDSRTGARKVVSFGLQYFLKHYMEDYAAETFFSRPKATVVDEYKEYIDNYLGTSMGVEHIAALHDYGRMPLEFYALPEGTQVPIRVPMFTIENTHPDFFWVPNYFETLISSVLWLPCTSATTAHQYREILDLYAGLTGTAPEFIPYQGHDFSFRGMGAPDAADASGAAHLLSFDGTDTVPSIGFLRAFYMLDKKFGPNGVPATEHSVMCAGGQESEIETFRRLLKLYPTGILSVVSDTWDLWNVIGNILPQLKEEILSRDGKLVIRPDSGDPVKIICGDPDSTNPLARKGVVEVLWDLFGGTITSTGHKLLNSHIGTIYGDSITLDRADKICMRLCAKGFASGNVVFGIGSFTYQYVTRDTYGFAVKATWALIDGVEYMLSKKPVTDSGMKFSAKGRVVVVKDDQGELKLIDNLTLEEQLNYPSVNQLQKVWSDGHFYKRYSFEDVRNNLKNS